MLEKTLQGLLLFLGQIGTTIVSVEVVDESFFVGIQSSGLGYASKGQKLIDGL